MSLFVLLACTGMPQGAHSRQAPFWWPPVIGEVCELGWGGGAIDLLSSRNFVDAFPRVRQYPPRTRISHTRTTLCNLLTMTSV